MVRDDKMKAKLIDLVSNLPELQAEEVIELWVTAMVVSVSDSPYTDEDRRRYYVDLISDLKYIQEIDSREGVQEICKEKIGELDKEGSAGGINMTEDLYYAVWQNGYVIYGLGKTRDEAIEAAKEWVENPDELEEELKEICDSFVGDMVVIQVTKDVKEAVDTYGGDVGIVPRDSDDPGDRVYTLGEQNPKIRNFFG